MYLGDFIEVCSKSVSLDISEFVKEGMYRHVATISPIEIISLLKMFDSERAIDYAKTEIKEITASSDKIFIVLTRANDEG